MLRQHFGRLPLIRIGKKGRLPCHFPIQPVPETGPPWQKKHVQNALSWERILVSISNSDGFFRPAKWRQTSAAAFADGNSFVVFGQAQGLGPGTAAEGDGGFLLPGGNFPSSRSRSAARESGRSRIQRQRI